MCIPIRSSSRGVLATLAFFTLLVSACSGKPAEASPETSATPPAAGAATTSRSAAAAPPLATGTPPPHAYEAALPPAVRSHLSAPFMGDLDQMVQRRLVRIGATVNRTFYFVDKGVQRGAAYEMGRLFEDYLNKKLGTKLANKVNVVFVPLPRDQMADALTKGKVDIVVAQVIVRPEIVGLVDFSNPVRENVSEVLVTGPGAPPVKTVDDLAGKDVYARRESSGWQDLVELNGALKAKGLAPVNILEVPGNLEDDDLLEMANAGILPMIVIPDYLAGFWQKIFTKITVHENVALRTGATIAVPMRKGSPQLAAELNAFLAKNGLGTALGNMLNKRYLVSTKYAKSATSEADRKKFMELVQFFRTYGDKYEMDYLLMAAQGYQESGLNQSAKSQVGAVGVMQLMPATGKELAVGDIHQTEANIHAGVKYMRFMMDRYYKDEPMDRLNKGLFTFASYNAGPARIRRLRQETAERGLDPNVWFGNVEQVASERIGRETVTYVSNIYKYYVAYKLMSEQQQRKTTAKKALESKPR